MEPSDIAQLNSFLLLDAVRSHHTVTRGELAKELGLSAASVSRLVRVLLAEGSIEELPGENGERGRTASLLRFVPRVGSVVAIDLGGTKCHGVLANLAGEVIGEDYRASGGPTAALASVLECLHVLRRRAESERAPVQATVIGIPALIDPDTNLAMFGPNVGWEGFDLLGSLREHLIQPVEVDNDVNLAALGQAWRGEAVGVRSYVTLSLGTGIGSGVVIDGRLARGRHNAAGEIGPLVMGRVHHEGDLGFSPVGFEQVASGPALRARAMSLVQDMPRSSLVGEDFDTVDVFAAAAAGDHVGVRVIEELLDNIAIAVINIAAILDPELVILDGSVGRAVEPWLAQIEERVEGRVFRAPALAVSSLGPNATLVGAIARALALASESRNPAMMRMAKRIARPSASPHEGPDLPPRRR